MFHCYEQNPNPSKLKQILSDKSKLMRLAREDRMTETHAQDIVDYLVSAYKHRDKSILPIEIIHFLQYLMKSAVNPDIALILGSGIAFYLNMKVNPHDIVFIIEHKHSKNLIKGLDCLTFSTEEDLPEAKDGIVQANIIHLLPGFTREEIEKIKADHQEKDDCSVDILPDNKTHAKKFKMLHPISIKAINVSDHKVNLEEIYTQLMKQSSAKLMHDMIREVCESHVKEKPSILQRISLYSATKPKSKIADPFENYSLKFN